MPKTRECSEEMGRRGAGLGGRLALGLCLALAAGCSDSSGDRDWDRELVLQLFKPAGTKVGQVTVTAVQALKNRTVTVNSDGSFFADCESNRIRIIPAGGQNPGTVMLSITTANNVPPGGIKRAVAFSGVSGDVLEKVALGSAAGYEPSGACAKGLDMAKKSVGEACTGPGECKDGVCLTEVDDPLAGGKYTFTGGYCSKLCLDTCNPATNKCGKGGGSCNIDLDCRNALCGTDQVCYALQDGSLNVKAAYCLKKCNTTPDCKRPVANYECSPGNACFPKSAPASDGGI